MKRLIVLILSAMLILSACGGEGTDTTGNGPDTRLYNTWVFDSGWPDLAAMQFNSDGTFHFDYGGGCIESGLWSDFGNKITHVSLKNTITCPAIVTGDVTVVSPYYFDANGDLVFNFNNVEGDSVYLDYGPNSSLSGVVVDAFTNAPVSGATVTLDGTLTTTTDGSGLYSFTGLESDTYAFDVSIAGYTSEVSQVPVVFDPTVANVALSADIISPVEYRIVLTWEETPFDLDLYLWTPDDTQVYFSNPGDSAALPFALLSLDDVFQYGPEAINIYQLQTGDYKFAVHNASQNAPTHYSGAIVRLYDGTGLLQEWTLPTGAGNWWNVFTLDGTTGAVTTINELADDPL